MKINTQARVDEGGKFARLAGVRRTGAPGSDTHLRIDRQLRSTSAGQSAGATVRAAELVRAGLFYEGRAAHFNAAQSPARVDEGSDLTEQFSFSIKDLKVTHFSEAQNLNITIHLRYETGIADKAYPDFRLVYQDIEEFLANYPNETDYWEIINKKLTLMVLNKYPIVSMVTSDIQISPTRLAPYQRSSMVTQHRAGKSRNR